MNFFITNSQVYSWDIEAIKYIGIAPPATMLKFTAAANLFCGLACNFYHLVAFAKFETRIHDFYINFCLAAHLFSNCFKCFLHFVDLSLHLFRNERASLC